MAAHDAGDGGEAQAAAGEPGREERLEEARPYRRPDARPGVRDLDEDVAAGAQIADAAHGAAVAVDSGETRRDPDAAGRAVDRFRRVQRQVGDDVADLVLVGVDRGQVAGQLEAQLDV